MNLYITNPPFSYSVIQTYLKHYSNLQINSVKKITQRNFCNLAKEKEQYNWYFVPENMPAVSSVLSGNNHMN